MSKLQDRKKKKKSLKLVHGAKCVSGWCGVPDADMARLILGGGQRGEDGRGRGVREPPGAWSPAAGAGAAGAGAGALALIA